VSITAPASGGNVKAKSTFSIKATASDNVGVKQVKFYVDGALICTLGTSTSYSCTWNTGKRRKAQIKVTATDAAGNLGSKIIYVNVQ
jgi:hypothetical protein